MGSMPSNHHLAPPWDPGGTSGGCDANEGGTGGVSMTGATAPVNLGESFGVGVLSVAGGEPRRKRVAHPVLLDSGASVSLTPVREMFGRSLRPTTHEAIVANGKRVPFDGVGAAFGLAKVYWMKSATSTLLAMSDLITENVLSSEERGNLMIFRSRADNSETWRFELRDGLYVLSEEDARVHSVFTVAPARWARATLLHRRLGHCAWSVLKEILRNQTADGLFGMTPADIPDELPYCRPCALGKIRRTPFLKVNPHRSTVPGRGWHVDVIVLRNPAITGEKYFLLFTDDAIRLWVGYGMRRKADSPEALEKFHEHVIRFWNLPIAFLKSDRGGEFTSERFRTLLLRFGIRQFLVTPRDPQANGAAERQGQTLFGDVRAVLIDSGLPPSFWLLAAHFTIYCRNRIPRRGALSGPFKKSPIEELTDRI